MDKIVNSNKVKLGIFFVIMVFLYLFKLGSYSLIDLDEPRYAEAAREMIENNNYLIPTFNYELRPDKPILFYWFEILSFKIFGINEFAARLPSALAGLALGFFAYLFAQTRKVGILAVFILLTSLEFFVMARLSVTDMLLNLFMSGALVLFYLVYIQKIHSYWLFASSLFLALGTLTKGPVALALPFLIVILFLVVESSLDFISSNFSLILRCISIFFLVATPWYLAAHFLTDGVFTQEFFFHHNLSRFAGVVSGHDGALLFYIPVILTGFMPWTFFLPIALYKSFKTCYLTRLSDIKDKSQCRIISFSFIWIFVFFFFYTSSATKLMNYMLPVYLPLATLTAIYIDQVSRKLKNKPNALISYVFIFIMLVSFAMALIHSYSHCGFSIGNYVVFIRDSSIFLMSFVLLFGSGISFLLISQKKHFFIYGFALSSFLILGLSIDFIIAPYSHFREDGIIEFISTIPKNKKLVSFRITRPSLSFYAQKAVPRLKNKAFKRLIKSNEPFYFISRNSDLEKLSSKFKDKLCILSKDEKYVYGTNIKSASKRS